MIITENVLCSAAILWQIYACALAQNKLSLRNALTTMYIWLIGCSILVNIYSDGYVKLREHFTKKKQNTYHSNWMAEL